MRFPRRRRPSRVRRWEGVVDEVYDDEVWTYLIPIDHDGPEAVASFDRRQLPNAIPGTLFSVYTHRRGRKVRFLVRERALPARTAGDLAGAKERGSEMSNRMKELVA